MDIVTIVKQVALSVLTRRKKWVLLVTLGALVVFIPVAFMMSKEPPRFRTSAMILIESRPDKTPLFQEFSPFRPLAVQLAILRSRSLAESVIETLPRASVEDLIENPYYRDYALELQNWFRQLRGQELLVESPQRRALAELQMARVRFIPQGQSGIVEILAEASKPRVALDIANTYIEVLLSRTRSFNVDDTKVTREYLEQQHAQTSQNMTGADNALRQFTLARGGIRPPAKNAETINRLSQIESQLAEISANRNISQSRLSAMKQKLDAMPAAPASEPRRAAVAPTATPPRIQMLRAKLATMERQLLEYETVYTDQHPRVTLVRSQIEDVKRELGEAVRETPQVAAASSASAVPVQDRQAFAETVAALETSVVALSAQEEALREQGATLRKSLSGLSKDEMEYQRLTTEVESNRRLVALIADKLSAARIREQGEMKVVKVIDPPNFPLPGTNEKRLKFIAFGIVLALAVGVGLPTVVEYFNRPVESEDDIRHLTGLTVLATVPRVHSRRPTFMAGGGSPDDMKQEDYFLFAEAFRRLRVELQLLGRDMPLKRILITSSLPGEGKSTVVVNLGLAFGEVGKQVIIADADFHRPTLHRTLKTPNTKGFSDLLAGVGEVTDSMSPVADGVWLSPRGASPTALTRTGLGSERLARVLDQMAGEAEYILLDSSPILLIPDNLYMAAAVDGVLLVVQSGTTRPRDLLRTKELFEKAGTPIVGVVINQMPLKRMAQYYNYYKHYKAYVKGEPTKA
jgi:capsular exopolysaccharide synthesis family protein